MTDIAEDYLRLIGDWSDPYPAPVVTMHQGVYVVRDDLLELGSKVRSVDYLIGHDAAYAHVKEWVFGSCPATGYAQISLPGICSRYGKQAVLFMAKRDLEKLHPHQRRGLDLGAVYNWVPNGMLPVTQARAREYVAADPSTRALLPLGLEHPTVVGSLIRVARALPVTPDYIWSVGSSGTLSRSLQLAFPNAEVHVVSVGHSMTDKERGRAILHRSAYKFNVPVRGNERPPFPSVPEYDAKGWHPMMQWMRSTNPQGTVLFWNVGA